MAAPETAGIMAESGPVRLATTLGSNASGVASAVNDQLGETNEPGRHKRQLADAETAAIALRQMVDALASLPALEHFVPAALRIVAHAFETNDCAYYEHRRGAPIRLRYWFLDGKVFGPDDIRAFADDHPYAGIKPLEAGFHVPDSYLGMPFRHRMKPLILNEGWDAFEGPWEALRRRLGWYSVLNVPLIVAGEADGGLVMNRGLNAGYTQCEMELAERLGQLLALAMEIDRLAAKAHQAASFRDGEMAANVRADEMAKTDLALQQTTDALAAMPDLDNFIPVALQIIARAFNARDCAYYEHRRGELIRLRYWFVDDRVFSPTEIAGLEGEEFAFMRQLAVDGFTVPDTYLGVPYRERSRASVVDHTRSDPPSVFDDYCNSRGWQLELNVPLVVAGEADGALIIYRRVESPYTTRELSLAERLGQQLALAMEASRLSAAAKRAAVADERERSARARTVELSRYADLLRQTIDSLVEEEDFLQFIGRLLGIASSQLEAPIAEYWTDDGSSRTSLVLTFREGSVYRGSDDADDVRTRGIPTAPDLLGVARYRDDKKHLVIDMLADAGFQTYTASFGMHVAPWCAERGVRQLIILPLLRNEISYGSFCLYFPADRVLDQPALDLAFSLGQQVSLAVRMTELADQSRESALSREREAAANERAVELARANDLLRASLDQLADQRDLHTFPGAILRIAMEETGAQDGIISVLDRRNNTLCAQEYLNSRSLDKGSAQESSAPFSVDDAPFWADAIAARSAIVYDLRRDGHMLLPGEAEWHRKRENRSVVIVPMFIDKEPYGYFGMGLKQPAEEVSKVELGLTLALTQQASLAIQFAQLAEESKQAALAQAREKDAEARGAEFAHANEVLRATLDQLSEEHDLRSYPRTILKEAMKQTGAKDGLILLYDKDGDTLVRSEYENAGGRAAGEEFERPFRADKTPAWQGLVNSRAPIVFDVERDGAMLLPGLAAWHRRHGNRSIIATAMFINMQPYGYFGVTLEQRACDVSQVKVGLIHALSQQATLAIQLTNLAEASQQAAITVERQQVVIQERANMARDIHDRLAQGYAAILMQQHTMRRTLLREPGEMIRAAPLLAQLDIIERLSKDNLAEARSTMDELRVDPLGRVDLRKALEQCVSHFSRDRDFRVTLRVEEELPMLRRYVHTELCRIVQEALTNARKHSRCAAAHIMADKQGNGLRITVHDDGIGFDVQAIGPSFGISSMQERAARAGATMEITSASGRGTDVCITFIS